ncbi:hypothetical protein QQX98_013031 [Neonectria punicea]|uniref:EF-hand domain-containing protein n=1 Tax=Neonectria punicea TaxID=979145 RepID=A0ABR1GH80_9HYPO
MSSKSWYVLKAKAVPARYGLSRNIQTLLQALDKHYTGSIDAAELGRLVRLSPKRRSAIANTISKCADMIKRQPEELKTCVDIIEMCTEILEIADRPIPVQGFPFMRLPLEIRESIMDLMIDNVFRAKGIKVACKKTNCNCPKIERDLFFQTPQMKALPSLLGPALNHEFFRIFFRKKSVRFRCCCEMRSHLEHNDQLRHNVRDIKVHWCGPESAAAFKKLSECTRLEGLALSISKSTLAHLNERSDLMKTFFPLTYRSIRITDVLGLDELMGLRGLQEVSVHHAQTKTVNLTVEMDRANLSELLSTQLKKPKEEGHIFPDE